MKKNFLKKFIVLSLVCLMVFSLFGCSSKSSTNTKESSDAKPTQSEKKQVKRTKVKVISWWDITKSDSLKQLKSKFEELNSDLELEFIQIGQGYADKILTIIAGGGDEVPDVMMLAMDKVPMFASNGAIVELDKYVTDKYKGNLYPIVLDACTYDGKVYSVARDVTSMAMYLNTKMFEEANVPLPKEDWTMDDFLEIAKEMTKVDSDGKPIQWGYYFPKYPDGLYDMILLHGGDFATADGKKSLMSTPETKEALQFMHDLIYKYKVCPTESQAKQFGSSGSAPILAGKVAMTIGGLSTSTKFNTANPKVEYAVVPLPRGNKKVTHAFVNAWAIPKGAKNPDLSWRVLEFFSSKEGQQIVLDTGMGLPASKEVDTADFIAANPYNKVFLDSLEYSVPFRTLVYGADFYNLVKKELEPLWLDKASVDEVTANIEKKASDILLGKE